MDRNRYIEKCDRYYRGKLSLPWMPSYIEDDLKQALTLAEANYLGLVIDAAAERMHIDGFRSPKNDDGIEVMAANTDIWRVWTDNGMVSGSNQLILESLIGGTAYIMVEPNDDDAESPNIYPEHPTQCIVDYVPGSNRRKAAAALKVWKDDWTGKTMATLFLPDSVQRFQTDRSVEGVPIEAISFKQRDEKGLSNKNPLGEIPISECPCRPRMLTGGVSEIDDLLSVQERIAKTLIDRLRTQDSGAFPQKWATGFPFTDKDGQPNRISIGRKRLVQSDVAETKFGQWDTAPLSPYLEAKREDARDIASRSRVPAQYLLGDMSNVNGSTLQAAESGHTSKIRERIASCDDGIRRATRLVQVAMGKSPVRVETVWRNPEYRSEGELMDALMKAKSLGVPEEALWERWGASPEEIERWKSMRDEEARRDPIGVATRLLGQQANGGATSNDPAGSPESDPSANVGDRTGVV